MARKKVFEDVWNLIDKRSDVECWEWLGCKNSTGYGSIKINQKTYSAHRIAYALTHPNTIEFHAPKDKSVPQFILHKCDNRTCCNPNHMRLGNYNDNNKDAKEKGRSNSCKGDKHKKAKLTNGQAKEVRLLHKAGMSYVYLSKLFNIHANNISRICRNLGYVTQGV